MLRRCSTCRLEKATTDFYVHRKRADRLQPSCKACDLALSKARHQAKLDASGKRCIACDEYKLVTEFYANSKGNRERLCASCREMKRNKRGGRWQKARDRSAAERLNPKLVPRFVLMDSRKSDKKRGRANDLTLEFCEGALRQPCSYCGGSAIRMTLDRVDNSIGHVQSNVVPACIRCNYVRGAMPYQAWLCLVEGVRVAMNQGLFGDWTGRARLAKGLSKFPCFGV
jgi:hypothetical protein